VRQPGGSESAGTPDLNCPVHRTAGRSLAAQSAAKKIREQARRDADREVSQNVKLDHDELREIAAWKGEACDCC